MNTQTHEALKMAITQLKDVHAQQGNAGNWDYDDYMRGLYNGLELALSLFESREPVYKEALAEVESESSSQPVAWSSSNKDIEHPISNEVKMHYINLGLTWTKEYDIPLHTHPATWQSLSDDEILKLANKYSETLPDGELFHFDLFARAIEQALKELNAKK